MSKSFEPRGAWTALATPFSKDGSVDDIALRRLVEFQVSSGVSGVVPCGTTGESPTLEWDEHERVIDVTVEVVNGRVGVLAGSGSNSTAEAIMATRHAMQAGASAALVVDCYYNGPSSLELREHYYEEVLAAVPSIPLVPYVVPGRCGCVLGAADLALLHQQDLKRVPAVKEATGDLKRMREERELSGPSLSILSGDDELTLQLLRDRTIGASGAISVMTNIVPAAIQKMIDSELGRDEQSANAINEAISPIVELVTCSVEASRSVGGRSVTTIDKYRNPVPVKTMMMGLGMLGTTFRSPLGFMSKSAVAQCRLALRHMNERDASLLAPVAEHFDVNIVERLNDDDVWSALCR
ncbi:MAG: 4-hydroxy-tetrahydrodipicolinate synthase [Polyangiales bacterium]